jgi:uncharacterized protein (TIGR02452 family)
MLIMSKKHCPENSLHRFHEAHTQHSSTASVPATSQIVPREWLKAFREASKNRNGFRELRVAIYDDTLRIVAAGGYILDGVNGTATVRVPNDTAEIGAQSVFYDAPPKLGVPVREQPTQFQVIEADCLEVALLLNKAGLRPCVLNMANRHTPGGGVCGGSGAQEENIFRRSNAYLSLYRYVDWGEDYGVPTSTDAHERYSLNRDTGGVYSGKVTVFRASEKNGYALLREPFEIALVTVAAINNPGYDADLRITSSLVPPAKEKIRTILRIAGAHGHDTLVLGAFGCGAFRTPPAHQAQLFKEVFDEDEFRQKFRLVTFAIFSDHNSYRAHNPDGNTLPFWETFEQ